MAFLMTDVAAGSDAALKLMQNMGAAPLAEQTGKAQAEQVIANTERTKLSNMVLEAGIKADANIRTKAEALVRSPDFVAASDSDKQRKLATVYMEAGKVEEGSKLLSAAEATDAKDVANRIKKLDADAQQVGNAYGVISSLPNDQVDSFFKRLPQEQQKALVDKIGEENWNKMDGAQKKEAAKNLMLNAKGQLAMQLKYQDYERQAMIRESVERVAAAHDRAAMERKLVGGDSKEDSTNWNRYEQRRQALENSSKKNREKLQEKVDAAQATRDKATFFTGKEDTALSSAKAALNKFDIDQTKKELELAASAPNFAGKKEIITNLKDRLELLGYVEPTKVENEPSKDDKTGKAAPAVSTTPAATTEDKGTQAPFEATSYLKNNPTEENKKFFKEKYGYLPEGLEAKDTRKYTRTKGTRGNWVYTPTNRGGMTKEEWAKQDEMGK
jgi:hypothetical protein